MRAVAQGLRQLGWSLRRPRPQLVRQVAWFNRLRFFAVAGMAAATFSASEVFGVLTRSGPLYLLCAIALCVNCGYLAWYRRLHDLQAVRRHVVFQVVVDLAILTLVLHFSGGVTNPLVLFYTFHTFIASMLLTPTVAVLVAAASVGLIAGLGFGESLGWIPHRPMTIGLVDIEDRAMLGAWVASLALVLGITVYFVSAILARLRASERELAGLSKQLALSEKLASIGTLAAGVSHEINNPVGVIGTKTEILRYRIADGDSEEALLGEIDTIEKHVGRIRAITEGLLAFSRETPFELRDVDLGSLVREAADLVRVSFDHASVTLVLQPLLRRGLAIRGSANHLLQVFVNVLLNAKDASSAGGRVDLWVESGEDAFAVHIADEGHGIPADHLGKIFDPFFTTKDVDKGTGLGLALSHGLVERHGGRIDVESEEGVGTRFSIWLPHQGVDAVESAS